MATTANKVAKSNGFDPAPLERARRLAGLTYKDLGELIGKTTGAVHRTFTGRSSAVKTVAELAKVLNVDVAECWPEPE